MTNGTLTGRPQTWTAGELMQLIRQHPDVSRSDLARQTGLSPTTIATRIESLLVHGFVTQDSDSTKGGRKPRALTVNPRWGVAVAAHLGARHTRVGIVDMVGNLVLVREHDVAAGDDVEGYLDWLSDEMRSLLDEVRQTSDDPLVLRGIGLSIPAPVDVDSGLLVDPYHFPAWNRLAVVPRFEEKFEVPVVIDNDVTLMALGEHRLHRSDVRDMLYVKLGSALGCGVIVDGKVYRGHSGGAGEIAHLPVQTEFSARCQCGRSNCLEACFGGAALIEHMRNRGHDIRTTAEFTELAESGDPDAVELARAAGSALGETLGLLSEFLNPAQIVLGGRLSQLEILTLALRSGLYARSHPLAARGLTIASSLTRENASILGAAWTIIDLLLSEERINAAVS